MGPGSFSSGDLYGAAAAARPTGTGSPSKSKSTSELQGFADSFRFASLRFTSKSTRFPVLGRFFFTFGDL